jgi:inner membrane transporter RhtA
VDFRRTDNLTSMNARPFGPLPAPLLVVVAMISLQTGAAIGKSAFDRISPVEGTFLRLALATVILFVLLRPRLRRWDARSWRAAIVLGLALGGMNQLIYLAIDHIPLGVAITIEFLGPLTLALAQTKRLGDAAWALLALGGVALLGLQAGGGLDPIGILFALGAATCWVGYILAAARLGAVSGQGGLAVSMLVATLLAVPLGGGAVGVAASDPSLLVVFAVVAVLSSAAPYLIEVRALRTMPTRVFGVLQSAGPAAAAVAGLIVLGEALDWREVIALVLISVASLGVSLTARPSPPAPAGAPPAP